MKDLDNMIIHNIRLGFATNSSSCHSIVLVPEGLRLSYGDSYNSQEFGWQAFTLSSKEEKLEYLGQIVRQQLSFAKTNDENFNEEYECNLASELLGTYIDPQGYVDHQSTFGFPLKGKHICKEFFLDFKNWLLSDNIAILGGNDNDGNHPNENDCTQINLPFHSRQQARYHEDSKTWVLFDKSRGTKIRLSFDNNPELKTKVEKGSFPELVDMKITNYCDRGCNFCYQNSTRVGKHASLETIKETIKSLSSINTFEIAIGGGEPTSHPDFKEIIECCAENSIVPNFSTRDLSYVKDNIDFLKDKIGGIGYSIGGDGYLEFSPNNAQEIKSLIDAGINVTLQIANETINDKTLLHIFQKCTVLNIPILLLGYKKVGRGEKYKKLNMHSKYDLEKVLDAFVFNNEWVGPVLSFDTVLVNQMMPWLNKHSSAKYWTKREGDYSMYIDCVENKMGQSSFCDNYEPIGKDRVKSIKAFFKTV